MDCGITILQDHTAVMALLPFSLGTASGLSLAPPTRQTCYKLAPTLFTPCYGSIGLHPPYAFTHSLHTWYIDASATTRHDYLIPESPTGFCKSRAKSANRTNAVITIREHETTMLCEPIQKRIA